MVQAEKLYLYTVSSVEYIRGGNLGSSEGVDVVWFCRSSTRPPKPEWLKVLRVMAKH